MTTGRFLSAKGDAILDSNGDRIALRGVGLGGWLNMENFITGYPANEEAMRHAVTAAIGRDKADFMFEKFLQYFFDEPDAAYLAELGLNCVRIPVNYRHFEDDLAPFKLKQDGFRHLDRAIAACARHGVYVIIDLHALAGFQNQHWHSDNPTHKALSWVHRHFQDRAVWPWEVIADHYKDEPWVAGYNLVNEPADPSEAMIMPVYDRLYRAIRAIDPNHIIFLEGNRYSQDFHMFGEPWEGVVYSNHDYCLPGFVDGGNYPGTNRGQYVDRKVLEETFTRRSRYMLDHGTHIWVSEFGPVYPRWAPDTHDARYRALQDQLDIYARAGASWSIWLHKDIGLQGLLYTPAESPYNRHIAGFRDKKDRLGADSWGSSDRQIRHVMEPIERLFREEFPRYSPFPFGAQREIQQLVRHILISEPLLEEYAALFKDLSYDELDELMGSFLFERCDRRTRLAELLSEYGRA
jgi:endoglucanase